MRRKGAPASAADLDLLVGVVKQGLPQQQERVSELRRKAVSMQVCAAS